MATETPKKRKSPDGDAGLRSGPVAQRVSTLREQAKEDPTGAREAAWGWVNELGEKAGSDRAAALEELQELFLCGRPADGIKGQTEGLLVTWTTQPLVDKVLGAITGAWMPWLGKKFDPAEQMGVNTLTNDARWPAKVLWPMYSTGQSKDPSGRTAFEFKTYVEAGKLDPSVDVLVIDYESVPTNPLLLIRQIRDELVQIVPGANLGKMLVSVPGRSDPFPALYFALKSEI